MSYILDYHAKPSFEPKGKHIYNLWMGAELEIECISEDYSKQDKAYHVNKALGDFIITKHDGSLNNGFEITSSPASLDYHRTAWDNFFKKKVQNGLSGFNNNTCGMHVHISREPLSNLQIGKIIAFIHKKENAEFVKLIAQRSSNKYNDFTKAKKISNSHYTKKQLEERHTAVNILNPNTIEIRIFKSNLRKSSFLRNIEFCAALVEFTWAAKNSISDSQDYVKFVIFVSKNRKFYPNLYCFLLNEEILVSKKYNEIFDLNKEKVKEINKANKIEFDKKVEERNKKIEEQKKKDVEEKEKERLIELKKRQEWLKKPLMEKKNKEKTSKTAKSKNHTITVEGCYCSACHRPPCSFCEGVVIRNEPDGFWNM